MSASGPSGPLVFLLYQCSEDLLTPTRLNMDISCVENSADPHQMITTTQLVNKILHVDWIKMGRLYLT